MWQAALDLGTDKFGFGFGGTGKKSNAKQFDNYGEAFGMHDVIGCLLDLQKGEIRFMKNGVDLGTAFTLNSQQKSMTYYPAVVLKNAEISFNFGAMPFKYPPPPDFIAVSATPKECVRNNPINSQSSQGDTSKPVNNAPQAIVIEPSRELAEQTYNQIQKVKLFLMYSEFSVFFLFTNLTTEGVKNLMRKYGEFFFFKFIFERFKYL